MCQQVLLQGLMEFVTKYTTVITMAYQLLTLGLIWLIFKIRRKRFCHEIALSVFNKKAIVPILVMGVAVQFFVSYAMELLPIPEEIVFRGIILSRFKKAMPTSLVVVLSSVLFGLVHLQFLWVIHAVLIGMLLAVVEEQEKSIGALILLHMAINFSALFVELIPIQGMAIVCVVAFAIIVAMLYTVVKKESLKMV